LSGDQFEELESALQEAAKGLKRYRELIGRLLGESEEERRLMLRASAGLSSGEIRVALEEYRKRRGL
jgi:hypothetical protein